MDKVEKVKKVIGEKGRLVADKAQELKEIAGLKRQIHTCEEVIRKNTMEIGQMVYARYEEQLEAEEEWTPGKYEKQCKAIANAKNAMTELKKKISEIKRKADSN